MAGEDDDTNLVSEVIIDGVEAAVEDLEKLGKAGADAFKKAGDAAEKAAPQVKKFGDSAEDAGDKADKMVPPDLAVKTAGIERAVTDLGRSLKKNVKEIVDFGARLAALGTAGAAAVGGIIAYARSVSQQLDGSTDVLEKNTKAQIDNLRAQQSAEGSAINYRSQLRQLQNQYVTSSMTAAEYGQRLRQLKISYQEQLRVQAEVEESQEALRKETERLQKQLADTKAYNALVDKFGAPLVASFRTVGAEAEKLRKDLVATFSPALASIVDVIGEALGNNADKIKQFAADTSKYIVDFVRDNKAAIKDALTGMAEIAGWLIKGFVEAAPAILKIINSVILPAVRAFFKFMDDAAKKINETFGTNISGGFLLISIALLKFTKGLQLVIGLASTLKDVVVVFNAISVAIGLASGKGVTFLQLLASIARFMGPWGIAITAISVALGILFARTDWAAWGKSANDAISSISQAFSDLVTWFQNLPTAISNFFATLWTSIQNGAVTAVQFVLTNWQNLLTWFTNLPTTFGALVDQLWAHIKETATALVTDVTNILQGIINWFVALPEVVGKIFTDIGTAIQNAFQSAFDYVQSLVAPWVAAITEALQPLITLIDNIKNFLAGGGSSAGGDTSQAFARGGHVGSGPVRGPGTGTSDSIFAWLSNGEFVTRAKAVAKYGLGFMQAINAGTLDLRNIGRYAVGGLVQDLSMPPLSLAGADLRGNGAGSTSALRPFSLHLGDQRFDGLLAPEAVANKLVSYAITKKTSSAGRKPSWLGRGS